VSGNTVEGRNVLLIYYCRRGKKREVDKREKQNGEKVAGRMSNCYSLSVGLILMRLYHLEYNIVFWSTYTAAEVFERSESFGETGKQLNWQRKDDGGVFLGADLSERLKITQLQRRR